MLRFLCISLFLSFTMAKNLPKTMKAVGLYKYLPITDVNSLIDMEVSVPAPKKREVLIEVKATAINPIDTKVRAPKPNVETQLRILGFDGAGIIAEKGEEVTRFKLGDQVFFTGDLSKNGTNAQFVVLDDLHVALKPKNLSFEQAAAMPLTSVTAYESLFDRLLLTDKDKGKSILIINSAGGVGSVASQLANNLGLKVIGTASRPETEEYSKKHGVHVVLNRKNDLEQQLKDNGYSNGVDFILVNYDPYPYWNTLMKVIIPQGRICLVVDSSGLVDIKPLKAKSITLVSEMMNTRIAYNTEDKYRHTEILEAVSKMLENGQLKSTLSNIISPLNAENLREAHKLIESQRTIGKIVLSGF
ncbi:zinc-type alcohol dehydrogenase-like protein SERP1785 [Colias croceus]|uniref:zinc-type alcohol dehydrogenase-like protein SERP1785 n=1 Tax=Colias crocea TaxID=72248 RepID=UPI001E27BA0E|nr:zinc-type alcohol dehydrogenase-like protein SERP1785 [Colias croceus]